MPPLTRRLVSLACAATLVASLLSIWAIFDPSPLYLKLDTSGLLNRIVSFGAHDGHRFWTYSGDSHDNSTDPSTAALAYPPSETRQPKTLGIADNIYVLSLPRRVDRRRSMERLRQTLGLQWTYVDATDADGDAIHNIHAHIRSRRTSTEEEVVNGVSDDTFQWPNASIIDTKALSGLPLGLADSDYCVHDPLPALAPLTCASKNYVMGPPFDAGLPGYMLLTPAKIACWYSHLEIIRKVAEGGAGDDMKSGEAANNPQADAVTVVLEDDVDMERDIHARLREVWGLLPGEWDIVFLGHCWSNESYYPALRGKQTTPVNDSGPRANLHPSFAPKCTHAYALTRTGARRLLLYLRHTPFAYSRALDQAISWLILSGKLKAFSVVPSVVVQRKIGHSDIDTSGRGMGSMWRDRLENGVLGS
ncbi:hypothetical protein FOMPIDRAFT_1124084 [Fomitopsis schrenkii]|uniref:Glycosyltransferase family 25 protein n=1 Tax=Fomitopsis schrenkii TaxID=2126942 RepID=S8E4G0_FOMSC|nr:hypothetical protein FOMPIDRAFT_1124084 [Fomitopsis schrenkii]